MYSVVTRLKSVSPYSQSRKYRTEKLEKESHAAYEERTWRDRMHVDDGGFVFIPPMAFKNCLDGAAKYLGQKIPGKGQKTYTKIFESAVLVTDPLELKIKKDDVPGEWLFVPADGIAGSGKRVDKCFPIIKKWEGDVTWHIFDDTITLKVFEETLSEAGKFVGLGRFRPARRGFYGRFEVVKVTKQ